MSVYCVTKPLVSEHWHQRTPSQHLPHTVRQTSTCSVFGFAPRYATTVSTPELSVLRTNQPTTQPSRHRNYKTRMTVTTSPHAGKTALPTWNAIIQAHVLFFSQVMSLLRLTIVWLLIVFIVNASMNWMVWPAEVANWPATNHFSEIAFCVSTVLVTLAGSSIAVSWHRAILLDEPIKYAPMMRLDAIVQTYFAAALFLTLMGLLPVMTLVRMTEGGNTPPLIALAMTCLSLAMAVWIAVRLIPLFPAIACDEDHISMGQAWLQTRGQFWRLFLGSVATLALPIIAAVAVLMIDPNLSVDGPPSDRTAFAIFNAATDTTMLFLGLIATAFASLIYRAIRDR